MGNKSPYFIVGIAIVAVMAAATLLAFGEDRNAGWELRPSLSLDKVHLIIRHSDGFGNNSVSGHDVPLDRLRGFSLAMLASSEPAKFEYVADAGRLLCEGQFFMGRGAGSYTFAPDAAFVSALRQMGYDSPDDDQLLAMLMMDIDRDFARGIRDGGLNASINDLIQLRAHGVTISYVRDARQAGFADFSAEDFIQLRIHGVETAFLRDLKAGGYNLRSAEIVQLRIHGVDSRYVRDLKTYGLMPDPADLEQMRIHGVTPEYLKGLKDAGYENLRAEEVDELRIHGVEPRFVQQARSLGYDFSPKELAQLRIHGVDGAYLKRLQDAGMRNLNAEQIAKLRIHGVD